MKNVLLLMFVLTLLLGGCDGSYIKKVSSEFNQQNKIVAFVGVYVVPMDSEDILNDQTVIVRDGIIKQIGDSQKVTIFRECRVNALSSPQSGNLQCGGTSG